MREIKISIETAQRWANGTDEELKGLALGTYPELAKKELPKSWEELMNIKGYFVNPFAQVLESGNCIVFDDEYKNIFATKEQAEASIALAQLSQLREVYRNGWVPNWIEDDNKYCIDIECYIPTKNTYSITSQFLSFQYAETRNLFLENFRELIEKAKPLMS